MRKKTKRTTRRRTRITEPLTPSPVEEIIADLANNDKPLLNQGLAGLSNLNPADTALWEQTWSVIRVERRRQIIGRLLELAEDNLELEFEAIFKYCLADEDAEIRCKAIEGLWESEDTSLIKMLINRLEQDESEMVQAAAATALGKFAMLAELNKIRSCYTSEIYQALLASINDKGKTVEVRRRAIEAAAPLSFPEITAAITSAYHSHNPRFKASAVYAMGKSCRLSWLPTLIQELENSDNEIRYEAAGACGELGEEEAVPHLIKLTADSDIDVQQAAIQALGKIGGREAKEHLEKCLDHPNQVIRKATEEAMGELEMEEDPLSIRRML